MSGRRFQFVAPVPRRLIQWPLIALRWPLTALRWLVASVLRNAQNVITAFVQIWANKGRSFLTTLGIIIAVTSIISVVAFVEGFGKYITNMVRGYGTQYVHVTPMWWRSNEDGHGRITMDVHDIEAVRRECSLIHRITPFAFAGDAKITYGREVAKKIPVRGVSEHYQTIRNFFVDAGRFFGPVDVENAANVIVLGRSVLKTLQSDDSIVGDHVQLDGERFRVIGLLEEKGNLLGDDQDLTVMIPFTTAINLYPNLRERLPFLAEAKSEDDINEACAQITRVLRQRHGIRPGQDDDFIVRRQDQALQQFTQVRNIASGILAGIVSISLVVGGVGIMNVMLVSVSERTREIGLRKSVGARRRDIMMQFLIEAIVLCTLGGVVGVTLGYAITYIAGLHPRMVDITVPLWSVGLALGFSAGAGIIFGIIPAFKAAILHPIDALRHE